MPRLIRISSVAMAAALCGAAAFAHPHAYVDAALALVTDGAGRLVAVQVDWAYGGADSREILGSRGYLEDGVVTPEELEALATREIDWAVVPGDLAAEQAGRALELGPIAEPVALWENERITLRHVRRLAAPLDPAAGPVLLKVYDPGFYTAYSLDGAELAGPDEACAVSLEPADLDEAGRRLGEALEAMGLPTAEAGPEDPFPEVGEYFADTVKLDCRP
ncbi:DUF1007 family protein [Mangrovicoccus ximenensis]|uniref:DUF1007 family protein n=1 Tax=Mangrovicoccus ximenensis TaxID=1911570 RepID=UPI000D35C3F7|nr:DUF1007 family protein [Mangrovicoccus ximenensis]